jgi:hypothetical protein
MEHNPLHTFETTLRSAAEEIKENSRGAAITALRGTVDFINSIPNFESDNLALTLTQLMAALHDLESGTVSPMLTPTKINNRKPQSSFRKEIRAAVIFVIDDLIHHGMPLDEAAKFAALLLKQAGVPIKGRREVPDWRTIIGWRNDHSRLDTSDQEAITLTEFRKTFSSPAGIPLKQRKDQLLKGLSPIFSKMQAGLE